MTALQKVARATPPVIFICADCGRQHISPIKAVPDAWALVTMDCAGTPFVRCPDCSATAQQAQYDRMTDYMTNVHPPQAAPKNKMTLQEHTALFNLGPLHLHTYGPDKFVTIDNADDEPIFVVRIADRDRAIAISDRIIAALSTPAQIENGKAVQP